METTDTFSSNILTNNSIQSNGAHYDQLKKKQTIAFLRLPASAQKQYESYKSNLYQLITMSPHFKPMLDKQQ